MVHIKKNLQKKKKKSHIPVHNLYRSRAVHPSHVEVIKIKKYRKDVKELEATSKYSSLNFQ